MHEAHEGHEAPLQETEETARIIVDAALAVHGPSDQGCSNQPTSFALPLNWNVVAAPSSSRSYFP